MKILLVAVVFPILAGCSKGNDPTPPDPDPGNRPPASFGLLEVADDAEGVGTTPVLSWQEAPDPDGDAVTYDLYFDTVANPATPYQTDIGATSVELTDPLQWLTEYHWRVVAKDGKGGETESNVYSFTTRDVAFESSPVTADTGFPARHWHTSIGFNDRLWVMGGFDGSYYNDVWRSSDGSSWEEVTSEAGFSARYGHTAAVFDGRLWVAGGYDGNRKNDIWYSTDGVDWTEATGNAAFTERYDHAMVPFKGKLWLIGGYTTSYQNDVWSSSDGITWVEAASLVPFEGRSSHTLTVFDDKLWVIGGFNGEDLNDIWYSPDGTNWTEATPETVFSERREHISASFAGRLWVISGFRGGTGGGFDTEVWHSKDGSQWIQAPASAPFSERIGHTAAIHDGRLWVVGGSFEGQVLNDVWVMD